MVTVEIEYCVPCGLLGRAIETQRELLETFGRELDGVRLTTGHGGVFRISAGGETVFDKDASEEGFDLDSIRSAVGTRIEDGG